MYSQKLQEKYSNWFIRKTYFHDYWMAETKEQLRDGFFAAITIFGKTLKELERKIKNFKKR